MRRLKASVAGGDQREALDFAPMMARSPDLQPTLSVEVRLDVCRSPERAASRWRAEPAPAARRAPGDAGARHSM
jgi:hypothetical protein